MITKKDFCILLQKIKNQDNKIQEICDKLYNIFGASALNIFDGITDCGINILSVAVDDNYKLIEYLVYDCNWNFNNFLITFEGRDYTINSFEDLYDLIEEWKEK